MRVPRVHPRPRAFTLVEILIVVIILGILATIIIGLFQNGTKDAAAASLKDNLRNMRSQLELYIAQHGRYPALATFEQQMTQYTDTDGNVSAMRTTTHVYGPYIINMPVLPVGVNKGRTTVTGLTYTAGHGWGYEPTSGVFKANTPDAEVDQDGIAFNTY
jgi:prepilin-type N-terminal cleavage/methylation domain-containing protein